MHTAAAELRDKISGAIRNYLQILGGGDSATLSDLARSLDELVMTYHATPDVEPDTVDSCAPRVEEKPIIDAAAKAYPDIGWYAVVSPEDGLDQQIGLSIGVGDLAEIAADLHEVLWLFENGSHNDAVWQFRWGYQNHWGRHLHEIRYYLHCLYAW